MLFDSCDLNIIDTIFRKQNVLLLNDFIKNVK